MQSEFRLSDSECSFLSQALVLAADKYVGFAVDAVGMAGGERLQQQFLRQACEARKFAIVFGDGVSLPTSTNLRQAGNVAGRITNKQFADTIRERQALKIGGKARWVYRSAENEVERQSRRRKR